MTLQQALAVMLYYRDHPVGVDANISGMARHIVYREAERAILAEEALQWGDAAEELEEE